LVEIITAIAQLKKGDRGDGTHIKSVTSFRKTLSNEDAENLVSSTFNFTQIREKNF